MRHFRPEPCGRCGHDVNDHRYDEENEMAHECEMCACDGFITKTSDSELTLDEQAALDRLHPDVFTRPLREMTEAVFIAGLRCREAAHAEQIARCRENARLIEQALLARAEKAEAERDILRQRLDVA